jgi:beta-mannosidase
VRVDELLGAVDPKYSVVYCELIVDGKVVSDRDYFFAPFKELLFTKPAITSEVTPVRNGFSVKLSADKFAKAIYLAVSERDGFFSDNYFNLAPNRPMTVEFHSRTPLTLKEFQERLRIRSMFDAFH